MFKQLINVLSRIWKTFIFGFVSTGHFSITNDNCKLNVLKYVALFSSLLWIANEVNRDLMTQYKENKEEEKTHKKLKHCQQIEP